MVVPKGVCLIEQGPTDCDSPGKPIGELQRHLTRRSTVRSVRGSLLAAVGSARRFAGHAGPLGQQSFATMRR